MAEISALEVALSLTGVDLLLQGLGAVAEMFDGAVTSAIDFQTELTQIQNNTTMTAGDMGALSAGVLQLAQDSGTATDTLGTGFMKAMNIVGDTAAAMAILTVATESAVSTGGNAATTTNVLANAMHEYGLDIVKAADGTLDLAAVQANAAHVMGVMHLAAAEGNMTLEQFSESSGKSIGIAANLGVSLEDVSAAFATLTKHGFDAAQSGTQVTDMLTHMINPTKAQIKELERVSKLTGVDLVGDFSASGLHAKGLTGVLADLTTAYRAMGLTQAEAEQESMKLINAQRGGLGLASLLGTGAGDYASILGDLNDQTKVNAITEESYNRTRGTVGNQWARLGQIAHTTAITVGSALLPALSGLLGHLIPLAESVGPAVIGVMADFKEVLGGGVGAGTLGGTLAVGFLLVKDTITNRVLPALRLLWDTFSGGMGVNAKKGILDAAGLVERLGRWFQLGVDAVVTFKRALTGDWFRNGSGNAFVDTIGRVGLAVGFLWRVFQKFGPGVALLTLWEVYVKPALTTLWDGFTGWVREKTPFVLAQLGVWGEQFAAWAGGLWRDKLWPKIQELWTAFTGWVGDRVPDVLAKLGEWGGAFKDWAAGIWTTHLAPGIVDLWHGFIKWIEDQAPGILTTLGTWGAAFGTWAGSIWTDHLGPGMAQLWTNFKEALLGPDKAKVVTPEIGMGGDTHATGPAPTGLLGLFGDWLKTLPAWATDTALPAIEAALTTVATGVQAWATDTGLPLLKRAGAAVMAGLTQAFIGNPVTVPPVAIGLGGDQHAGEGASTNGWLSKMLNDGIAQATAWVAGPGADAIGTLNLALWGLLGAKIAPAIISGLATHWQEVLNALGALIENSTLPGLVLKWAYPLGTDIGTAIYKGIADTPLGAFIRWLNGNPGKTGAGQGGAASDYAGPGSSALNYTGKDGKLHDYAPGAGGGFQIPDPNNPPKGGTPAGAAPNIYITMTGPTTAELAQSMADHLYTAVSAYLGPGGGGAVPA